MDEVVAVALLSGIVLFAVYRALKKRNRYTAPTVHEMFDGALGRCYIGRQLIGSYGAGDVDLVQTSAPASIS